MTTYFKLKKLKLSIMYQLIFMLFIFLLQGMTIYAQAVT